MRFGKEEDFVLNRSAASDMMMMAMLLMLFLLLLLEIYTANARARTGKIHNKNTITRMEKVTHRFSTRCCMFFSLASFIIIIMLLFIRRDTQFVTDRIRNNVPTNFQLIFTNHRSFYTHTSLMWAERSVAHSAKIRNGHFCITYCDWARAFAARLLFHKYQFENNNEKKIVFFSTHFCNGTIFSIVIFFSLCRFESKNA